MCFAQIQKEFCRKFSEFFLISGKYRYTFSARLSINFARKYDRENYLKF